MEEVNEHECSVLLPRIARKPIKDGGCHGWLRGTRARDIAGDSAGSNRIALGLVRG